VNVTDEPVKNGPVVGAVNVKTKELPVEPVTAVDGDTVIVPEPVAAGCTTVRVGEVVPEVPVPMAQPRKLKYSVAVIVKVPLVDPAVTEAPVKVAVPFDATVTQLLVGAVHDEPAGRPDSVSSTKSPLVAPATVMGLKAALPPGATGLGDWAVTTMPKLRVSVGEAVAVATVAEPQVLELYSVAVMVKDPPIVPAVTEVPVKLAALPATRTQSLVGALKVAPLGSPEALNFT
jgi:hypothetical protein